MNTDEPDFSLDGVPIEFGQVSASADDKANFPCVPGYRILRLLGQGGMGTVYEAESDKVVRPQPVALKTLFVPKFQTIQAALRQRFERELRLLASLQHENIVPVLDHGTFEQSSQCVPYFTMPMMNGDLAEDLAKNPVRTTEHVRERIKSLCGILDGLQYVHANGIAHRDLKPRNIFVAREGTWLLGDFGLAKILQADSELTSTIGHMGTTPYAPPEQLLSAKLAGTKADIFAIGVILYEMLCFGKRPFSPDVHDSETSSETDSIARWQTSLDRAPLVPSNRPQHLSDPSLDFIVQKCLAYYPQHRFESVEELTAGLRAWLRGETVRGTILDRFRMRVMPAVRKHRVAVSLVGLALIAVVWFGLWSKYRSLEHGVTQLKTDNASLSTQAEEQVIRRKSELRKELESIVPKLKGEELDFNTRRDVNSAAAFATLNRRAMEIASELELENSESNVDRHTYWAIRRGAVPADVNAEYVDHLRWQIKYCEETLRRTLSEEITSQTLAFSDVLRARRLLLDLIWYIEEHDIADENRELVDSREVTLECATAFERYAKLSVVSSDKPSSRHLKLLELELRAKSPGLSGDEILSICRQAMPEFTAARLESEQCTSLFPWYLAWYLFEWYYENAKANRAPASELLEVADHWCEVSERRPSQVKAQNYTHQVELIIALDRRSDALRDFGRTAESRNAYEDNWDKCQRLLTFYSLEKGAWDIVEQAISSMIVLAERSGTLEDRVDFYTREQALYRDKLKIAAETPGFLKPVDIADAKYELADSFFDHASLLDRARQQELLDQARTLAEEVAAGPHKEVAKDAANLLQRIQSLNSEKGL